MPTTIKKGKRRGEPYRFVITKQGKKTITRGYKDHGGPDQLYIRLSRLPKGTRYLVNYNKNRIIQSPRLIEAQVSRVRARRGAQRKRQKQLPRQKKIPLPKLPVIRRVTPPTPPLSKRSLPSMPGTVYYDQEHSLNEFITAGREQRFLQNIITKATNNKKLATQLIKQWGPDTRLKFSYVIRVKGVDKNNNQLDCASFSLIGSKPRDIIDILNKTGLKPGEQVTLRETDRATGNALTPGDIQHAHHRIGNIQLQSGTYRLFDVKVGVKFYNNPQQTLR